VDFATPIRDFDEGVASLDPRVALEIPAVLWSGKVNFASTEVAERDISREDSPKTMRTRFVFGPLSRLTGT
jgi:hypothetical protein